MSAVSISSTTSTQATLTVAPFIALPGGVFTVVATNPNGVSSIPVTFTVTNTIQAPAFLNPGPQTFVGGGSVYIAQTSLSSGITWTRAPTTGVTLTNPLDSGVYVTVSDGIQIASPTNYTITATDAANLVNSQTFTIQNTFTAPVVPNPGTQTFSNGGTFTVSQTNTGAGQISWSINPTTGVSLSNSSKTGVTVTVSQYQGLSAASYTITATNPVATSCVQSFSITNTVTVSGGAYLTGTALLSTGSQQVTRVVTDSSGNIYVVGGYRDNPTIFNLTANPNTSSSGYALPSNPTGTYRGFLIKYNSSGVYQFSTAINDGAVDNCYAQSVRIDSSGNIYIGGTYRGMPTLYNLTANPNTSATANLLPNNGTGYNRVFIIKWNSAGTYQYSTGWINGNYDSGVSDLEVDSAGNLYACGAYYGAPTIYNLTVTPATSSSGYTLPNNPYGYVWGFCIKWNSSGTYVNSTYVPAVNNYQLVGINNLVVDSSDNIYLNFGYRGTPTIYQFTTVPGATSTGITFTNNPTAGFYPGLVKFNSAGTYQSSFFIPNSAGFSNMTVDSAGSLYLTGSYSATPTIYNLTSSPNTSSSGYALPNNSFSSLFVIKFNSSGVYQLSTAVPGSGGGQYGAGASVAINPSNGDIYYGGYYNYTTGTTIYNMSVVPNATSSGFSLPSSATYQYGFIIKYNSSGVYQSSTVQNSGNNSSSVSYMFLRNSLLYVLGNYFNTPVIYNMTANPNTASSGYSLPNTTAQGGFLLQYAA